MEWSTLASKIVFSGVSTICGFSKQKVIPRQMIKIITRRKSGVPIFLYFFIFNKKRAKKNIKINIRHYMTN